MSERFFSKADELRAVVASNANDINYVQLIDQLQIEFAAMSDEFQLWSDEDRANQEKIELAANVKHTYFSVGVSIMERALQLDLTQSIPCGQPTPVDEPMQINTDENNGATGIHPALNTGQSNESQTDNAANVSVQLAYKDFVQMINPILGITPMQSANEALFRIMIETIDEVQKKAEVHKYKFDADERVLVAHIHRMLDMTSQELWEWHLMDNGDAATLPELIHFLQIRIRRMPKVARTSNASENWDVQSSSGGTSNPPKRWKPADGCAKCGRSHELADCRIFMGCTIGAKSKVIHQKKLCMNCFSPLHIATACPEGPCAICAPIKHHPLLCSKNTTNF